MDCDDFEAQLRQLRRHLKRQASTLNGAALRQSRRIEGGLSRDREVNAYRAVMCYIQKGLGQHKDSIEAILNEVAKFQWGDRHYGYPFCLFSFDWEDDKLHHEGKALRFPNRANPRKLAARLSDLAGTVSSNTLTPRIPALFPPANPYASIRYVSNKDLAIFFCKDRSVVLAPSLEEAYLARVLKRAVWVFLTRDTVKIELGRSFIPQFADFKKEGLK